MNLFNGYVGQVLGVILVAILGFLGVQAKNLYKKYVNTEIKQAVCRSVVRFVEQVYIDIHGPEKLHEAMKKASELLEGYGISITEDELVTMIEAAVNEFNGQFNKNAVYHIAATGEMTQAEGPGA